MFEKVWGLAPATWIVIFAGAIVIGLLGYGMYREGRRQERVGFFNLGFPEWATLAACVGIATVTTYEVHLVSLW